MGETQLPQIISLFALSFLSFLPSIPVGIALGLNPLVVFLTTALGYIASVLMVALLGERVRDWILKRIGAQKLTNPDSRIYRVWERYGVAGLGLLAPLTIGAQGGTVLGLTLNAKPRPLILWMSIGALVVGGGATLIAALGAAGITAVTG